MKKNLMVSTKLILSFALMVMLYSSCKEKELTAQDIVDRSIAAHGGDLYERSFISFKFRDRNYAIYRDGGMFTYERMYQDSIGSIHDYLNNDYFAREVNGRHFPLGSADSTRFANGLNSIIYFALLPYALNDPAVKKTLLEPSEIESTKYYKVKVTFSEEGGGEDFEDVYVYWFNAETFTMDYLAYSFKVNGGGTRFRKAQNRRVINGITFQDYLNYSGPEGFADIARFDELMKSGEIKLVSEINLENIQVEIE